jgi:hypothetical protein
MADQTATPSPLPAALEAWFTSTYSDLRSEARAVSGKNRDMLAGQAAGVKLAHKRLIEIWPTLGFVAGTLEATEPDWPAIEAVIEKALPAHANPSFPAAQDRLIVGFRRLFGVEEDLDPDLQLRMEGQLAETAAGERGVALSEDLPEPEAMPEFEPLVLEAELAEAENPAEADAEETISGEALRERRGFGLGRLRE